MRGVLVAQQPHRSDRPAQQAAQDVAAALVAGGDPVGDQHQPAADVVGHDPHPDVVVVVGAVPPAGELLGPLDHGVHHVDLVDVVDALQQVGDALEPHPGVDVPLRQRADDVEVVLGPDRAQLVLHEDEVPDLEVAILELGRHHQALGGLELSLGAVLRTAVVEDLRGGPAGSGHAHRPVVLVRPELDDPLGRQAGHLHPDVERLVVAMQDRRPEPALLEPEAAVGLRLGDQVPRVLDGAFLEVVAEGEVAAHLEERAVPGRLADVLDVGRADALLHAHRSVVRRRLLPEEVGLERHHPRVHEQQRRVVEDQRRRGHPWCAAASKCATNLRRISAVSISPDLPCRHRSRVPAVRPHSARASMRHEAEPLTQLGFGLRLPLGDLVAQHPRPQRQRLPAGRSGRRPRTPR